MVEAVTAGYVVELFGLPGSGKSTIASALRRASAGVGLPLDLSADRVGPDVSGLPRIGRKLGLAAAETIRRPVGTAGVVRSIAVSQRTPSDGAARAVQWAVTQRLMTSASSSPGVHVFDEGVMQALWSVGIRGDVGPTLRLLERSFGRWAAPDLVLALNASIDHVEDRLEARGSRHSRTQEVADPVARRRELARGAALADGLLGWWEALAPGSGRGIDAGLTPGALVGDLIDLIATRSVSPGAHAP